MHKMRIAFIAATVTASAFAVACSDTSTPLTAPPDGVVATSGTWTSTLWQPSAEGLKYVGSRSGAYRSAVNGAAMVDSGVPVQLDAQAIAAGKERVETETVLARMNDNSGGLATLRSSGNVSQYRPQLRNARTVKLGTKDGRAYTVEQSVNPHDVNEAPQASIISVDGKPVAIRNARYKKVRGRQQLSHSSTTLLDSVSNSRLVIETDFGEDAVRNLSLLDRARAGMTMAGDALATFVLPATLHAESLEDDTAVPCQTELETQLKAVAAWSVAMAALVTAIATCPATGLTCAAIPFLQIGVVAADVAMGVAIGNYAACMINYNRAKNPPAPPSGGGGSNNTNTECTTIDWYISYDRGKTWAFYDETTTCHTEYQI